MRASRGFLAVGWLAGVFSAACGDSGKGSDTGEGSASSEPASVLVPECQRLGYPCALAAVEPEVMERSLELGAAALDRVLAGTTSDAMEWLAEQPGVVEVIGSADAIRFRLDGGRGIWVFGEHDHGLPRSRSVPEIDPLDPAEPQADPAVQADEAGPQASRPRTPGRRDAAGRSARSLLPFVRSAHAAPVHGTNGLQGVSSRLGVVGKDRNNDGKLNNRDPRRGLVLSPFKWQFGAFDEGALISDWLRQTRGYEGEGSVTYLEDERAGVAAFMGWDEHDLIHVSSHGGVVCPDQVDFQAKLADEAQSRAMSTWKDCWTSIWTGTTVEVVWPDQSEAVDPSATPSGLAGQPVPSGSRIMVRGSWPDVPGLEVNVDCVKERIWYGEYETDANGNRIKKLKRDAAGYLVKNKNGRNIWLGEWRTECAATGHSAKISVSPDFFVNQYPAGLEKALVFLSTCHSDSRQVRYESRTMLRILVGGGGEAAAVVAGQSSPAIRSLFFGWDWPVRSGHAYRAAGQLYEQMLFAGHSARSSYRRLVQRGWHRSGRARLWLRPTGGSRSNDWTGSDQSGTNLRLRELVSLHDSDGDLLEDFSDISEMLVGKPGDGQPDELAFSVSVDGVEAGQEGEFSLRFELDGDPIGGTYDLSGARRTAVPMTLPYGSTPAVYVLDDLSVDTGIDLTTNQKYGLEAIVELPEGGESRYEAVGLSLLGCSWEVWVDGKHIIGEEGDKATFVAMPGGMVTIGLEQTNKDGAIGLSVQQGGPRQGETGSFDAAATGNLGVSPGETFMPSEAGALSLSLTDYGEDLVRGSAAGSATVFAPGPSGMQTRTVQIKAEFSVRRSEDPSGTGGAMATPMGMGMDHLACSVGR